MHQRVTGVAVRPPLTRVGQIGILSGVLQFVSDVPGQTEDSWTDMWRQRIGICERKTLLQKGMGKAGVMHFWGTLQIFQRVRDLHCSCR